MMNTLAAPVRVIERRAWCVLARSIEIHGDAKSAVALPG